MQPCASSAVQTIRDQSMLLVRCIIIPKVRVHADQNTAPCAWRMYHLQEGLDWGFRCRPLFPFVARARRIRPLMVRLPKHCIRGGLGCFASSAWCRCTSESDMLTPFSVCRAPYCASARSCAVSMISQTPKSQAVLSATAISYAYG